VDKAMFRAGIAAFQLGPNEKTGEGVWTIPWSPNFVAMYQSAFFEGTYTLAHAWQEVPVTFFAALNDTIRNRVLKFALELQEELGSVGDDPTALPPDRVDQTVINNIFGGQVVIATRIEEVTQAGSMIVMKGDVAALAEALKQLGADSSDVQTLQSAIAEDEAVPLPSNPFGRDHGRRRPRRAAPVRQSRLSRSTLHSSGSPALRRPS
jgi:hypothetical protein